MADGSIVGVSFPRFLVRGQAAASDTPNEYTDVLIGLPMLKSYFLQGITGALKLHYGMRHSMGMPSGMGIAG